LPRPTDAWYEKKTKRSLCTQLSWHPWPMILINTRAPFLFYCCRRWHDLRANHYQHLYEAKEKLWPIAIATDPGYILSVTVSAQVKLMAFCKRRDVGLAGGGGGGGGGERVPRSDKIKHFLSSSSSGSGSRVCPVAKSHAQAATEAAERSRQRCPCLNSDVCLTGRTDGHT
jgi:hypothetical protein